MKDYLPQSLLGNNKRHADMVLVNSPTANPQGCNVYSKPQTPILYDPHRGRTTLAYCIYKHLIPLGLLVNASVDAASAKCNHKKSSVAFAMLLLLIQFIGELLHNKSQSTAERFNLQCFAFIQFACKYFFAQHIHHFFLYKTFQRSRSVLRIKTFFAQIVQGIV